ncbi:MAG: protein jag [Lachnospiraceae bacterium]|nr:protein jag [Lachnospiraceae bacterium]
MEFVEFSAKNVSEAIKIACDKLEVPSDKLEYEVLDEGREGLFGIGAKPAVIKAKVKGNLADVAKDFLADVFRAMDIDANSEIEYEEGSRTMSINLVGEDMGILIGKRGQTLDSLQYLVSLVVNKEANEFIRVKMDTENYRERRKKTLEGLARNVAFKVKRSKRPTSLEPMNPYERRIIHSALQGDRYVSTHSEGDEPYRYVVVTIKR